MTGHTEVVALFAWGSTIEFYMEYVKGKNNTASILILLLNGSMISMAPAKPYPLPQETFLGLSDLPQQSGPSTLARRPGLSNISRYRGLRSSPLNGIHEEHCPCYQMSKRN